MVNTLKRIQSRITLLVKENRQENLQKIENLRNARDYILITLH